MSDERDPISDEERRDAIASDDVEGHMLSSDDRGAVDPGAVDAGAVDPGAVDPGERRAFPQD